MTPHDSNDQDLDWAQTARYFAGELAPEQARAFERQLECDDSRRQLLTEVRASWEASRAPRGAWNVEAGLERLRESVVKAAPAPLRLPPGMRRAPAFIISPRRLVPMALAASLVALAASGAALWSWYQTSRTEAPAPAAMNEVATQRGQRADILLPDGSRVTLGVASRLRYPRDFGVGSRTLELKGEAYFHVVHDDARPFRVQAGPAELEDIGTAFVVRAYDREPVRAVVAEGAIVARRAAAPSDTALLTAGQLAVVDRGGIAKQNNVSIDRYTAWMRNELVFDDAPLDVVAEELSRWYDIEVRIADGPVGARRFTGTFLRQGLESILRRVAAAANVTVQRDADGWRFQ